MSWPLFSGMMLLVLETMDRIDAEISGWWGWPVGLVVAVMVWGWVLPLAAEVKRRSSFRMQNDRVELSIPTTMVCALLGLVLAGVSLWWLPDTWWATSVAAVAVVVAGVVVTEIWRKIVARRDEHHHGLGEAGLDSV